MSSSMHQAGLSLMNDLLARGVPATLEVRGFSMSPLVEEGDTVVVEPIRGAVARGDLLVYEERGRVVCHALHFSLGCGARGWLLLKGAANRRGDPPVARSRIIGRVTGVRRAGETVPIGRVEASLGSAAAWLYLLPRCACLAARKLVALIRSGPFETAHEVG